MKFNTIDSTDLIKGCVESLDASFSNTVKYNKPVWRIKWRGEFIKTDSGKTAWSKCGNAKLAFWNHFNYRLRKVVTQFNDPQFTRTTSYTYTNVPLHMKHFILDELQKIGLLEFVEVK